MEYADRKFGDLLVFKESEWIASIKKGHYDRYREFTYDDNNEYSIPVWLSRLLRRPSIERILLHVEGETVADEAERYKLLEYLDVVTSADTSSDEDSLLFELFNGYPEFEQEPVTTREQRDILASITRDHTTAEELDFATLAANLPLDKMASDAIEAASGAGAADATLHDYAIGFKRPRSSSSDRED